MLQTAEVMLKQESRIKGHVTLGLLASASLLVCRRRTCTCWGSSRKWTPPRAPVHCGIWMRTQNTSFTFRASVWEAAAPPVSRFSSEPRKSRKRWLPRAQVRDNKHYFQFFFCGYLEMYLHFAYLGEVFWPLKFAAGKCFTVFALLTQKSLRTHSHVYLDTQVGCQHKCILIAASNQRQ